MIKLFLAAFMASASAIYAEPVKADSEVAFEDLFSEEDLAALKDEEEAILFDEVSDANQDPEELFQ